MGNFLDGIRSKSVSPERLVSMAKIASNRYLAEGVPLNSSVSKIASENDLNSHQIARVCEMANQQTHQALWKTAQEKEKVAFEVANPAKIVIIRIGGSSPADSTPCSADFAGPPGNTSAPGPSMAEMFGVDPEAGHNGLSDIPEKKRLVVVMQKSASAKQSVSDDLLLLSARYESEEKELFRLVKQAYFGEGLSLEDMYAGACQMGYGQVAGELFPKFAEQLHRDTARKELTKIAWKAPDELIDYDVPVTIVNGRHPIMISLNTLQQYLNQEQKFNWHLARINDENTIMSQRFKELQ